LGCRPPINTWRLYSLPLFLDGGFAIFMERGSFKKKKLKTMARTPSSCLIYIKLI
jgi:hypothetical protein